MSKKVASTKLLSGLFVAGGVLGMNQVAKADNVVSSEATKPVITTEADNLVVIPTEAVTPVATTEVGPSSAAVATDTATTATASDVYKRQPVPTTSTETVADSGASVVSGQGTSGTAAQGGTETVSATPTTVATNAFTEPSANTSTTQASQEASAVLTNTNQVTPAVPVQAETVTEPAHEGQTVDMQILSTTDLHTNLVNYDYYQDKPSQTVGLSKTAVLIKKARETNPNTVLVDSGDTIQGTPFGTYKALIDVYKRQKLDRLLAGECFRGRKKMIRELKFWMVDFDPYNEDD